VNEGVARGPAAPPPLAPIERRAFDDSMAQLDLVLRCTMRLLNVLVSGTGKQPGRNISQRVLPKRWRNATHP
jgi:hypothetical protein